VADRRLVSANSRIALPPYLADDLPARWRDLVPHIERVDNEHLFVRPGQELAGVKRVSSQAAIGVHDLERTVYGNCVADAAPSWMPGGRLAEMARDGVVAEVLIAESGISAFADTSVEVAWARLANDWQSDVYQAHYETFAPGAILPTREVGAAVHELERAAALGLRPAVLPEVLWERPWHDAAWEELWEAAESLEMPIFLDVRDGRMTHYVNGTMPDDPTLLPAGRALAEGTVVETIGWLIFSAVFDRHPDLKVVISGGAGLLSWVAEFFDYAVTKSKLRPLPGPVLAEKPIHYVRTNLRATFTYDQPAILRRQTTGVESLLWGSSYPYEEGSFLRSQEWVAEQFAGVPEDDVDRITRTNAAELFRLEGAR
jgi:predicted TIM-barrel fold metal-dependent hydrolase